VTLRIVAAIEQTVGGKHRVVQSDLYDLNTGRQSEALMRSREPRCPQI
jgi:hypothetical protein